MIAEGFSLEFITDSESLVWLAKWISIVSFALIGVVTIGILILRVRLVFEQRRDAKLHAVWQPILVDCLDTLPDNYPILEKRGITTFLVLWNYFHETLRDAGKENLNQLARHYALDQWSDNALSKGSIRERLLAIQTLGWLQEESCWEKLEEIIRSASPVTSLCAAKSLVRIDPVKGIEVFLPMVAVKQEWSYSTVGNLLREVGAEIVTEPLLRTAKLHKGEELVRLLRFIRIAYEEKSAPVISELLNNSQDNEVLLSCLRGVDDPVDLPRIRELLKHENWQLRTQAAICLGRLGTAEDFSGLAHAAGDQEWWVRFRAANAIANIPGVSIQKLKKLAVKHHNPFASEAILQVCLEKEALR